MTRLRIPRSLMAWAVVLWFLLLGWGFTPVEARPTGAEPARPSGRMERSSEIDEILSALESKFEGRRLPEKAREKLSALSDGQLRLLASLSIRMLRDDRGIAGDIAFFLITSLIVLS